VYLLSADDHNSVNGIRTFAQRRGAEVTYLPLQPPELRLDDAQVRATLAARRAAAPSLFAYPAQSNYSGVQHPLDWVRVAQEHGWRVLVDAAAFLPTSRLDLGTWHPDFVSVSWYKLFGYPTGLGSLIARREALSELERPWFAGGSIGVVSVAEPRHTWAPAETGFEDGTIDYLGIPAVPMGLRHLGEVGIDTIGGRVRALTARLLDGLTSLRHRDGAPLIRLYGPRDTTARGGTIPFNVLDASGSVVEFPVVETRAATFGVSVRTGCFCNPGASEAARGITAEDMRRVFALGHRPSFEESRALLPGKALGAVRASVGIATVERDLDRLLAVLATFADDPIPNGAA
jgi:selenocysteine lyase/cysteine desulfurase